MLVLDKGLSGHMDLFLSLDFHAGRWEGPALFGQRLLLDKKAEPDPPDLKLEQ